MIVGPLSTWTPNDRDGSAVRLQESLLGREQRPCRTGRPDRI